MTPENVKLLIMCCFWGFIAYTTINAFVSWLVLEYDDDETDFIDYDEDIALINERIDNLSKNTEDDLGLVESEVDAIDVRIVEIENQLKELRDTFNASADDGK